MAHSSTVLSQMLKMVPRHNFEKLANTVDGKVRSTALSRWSQFVALSVGQLSGRRSLRDIESCLSTQRHLHYHLGAQTVRGIYWVTRIRGNAQYTVLEHRDRSGNPAITSDQIIKYSSKQRDGDKLYPIRRIGYRDPESGRHYVYITNHFSWSAQTIAEIYKQRWQVELFFK